MAKRARILPALQKACPYEAELDRIAQDRLDGYATEKQARQESAAVRRAQREAREKVR